MKRPDRLSPLLSRLLVPSGGNQGYPKFTPPSAATSFAANRRNLLKPLFQDIGIHFAPSFLFMSKGAVRWLDGQIRSFGLRGPDGSFGRFFVRRDFLTEPLIPKHGGYRKLKSFLVAQLVYDVTVRFCERYIDRLSRTRDQMVQAARSGKQNIAEGSMASGTSRKMEVKLVGVARASLEELLLDYEDFLRQRGLALWGKNLGDEDVIQSGYVVPILGIVTHIYHPPRTFGLSFAWNL